MKPHDITGLYIAFFAIAVLGLGAGLLHIRHRLTPQILEGWEPVQAFINHDADLKAEWEMLGDGHPPREIVVARARKAMFQAGDGFYVRCKYDPAGMSVLTNAWKAVPSKIGTWRDYVTGADHSGVRYDLRVSPVDGPVFYAVVDSSSAGVVHYCGYAGDG